MNRLWRDIETWLIVTLVTLLVWVYAEGENVKVYANEPARVVFVAAGGQSLAIAPNQPQEVLLTFRCATSQLARVQRLRDEPLEIEVAADPSNPRRAVVLRDRLLDRFRAIGVELDGVRTPDNAETIEVYAEPMTQVQMDVTAETGELSLASPPQLEPGRVMVALPASLSTSASGLSLVVDLSGEPAVQQAPPNVPQQVTLPVRLPVLLRSQPFVSVSPSQVRVTFTLREQNRRTTVQSVPIVLSKLPPAALGRYRIEIAEGQRVLPEPVELIGPTDVIEQIERGDVRVFAELELTEVELQQQITSKAVTLRLPAGVRSLTAAPRISFTVSPQ